MSRCFHLLFRRWATCWALAAVFAFVLDGAVALDRHVGHGPDSGIYHGTHVHFHLAAHTASDQHHHGSEIENDHAGHHHGAAPGSGTDASCCSSACFVGAMLPCPSTQAHPLMLQASLARPPRDNGDGIEPEGLRKPPRPLAIA